MEDLDKILLWILYADILLIAALGVNVFRDKLDFGFYKRNYFKLIILPVTILTFIGILLYALHSIYVPQYITLCGPILTACIAYFIALFNLRKTDEKSIGEKMTFVKQIKSLLSEGVETLVKERNNYNALVTNIQSAGIQQTKLDTTPFIHFEIINNFDNKTIYNAIISIPDKDSNYLEDIYLEIVKQNSNALFIKENSKLMYETFNNSFNRSATKYTEANFKLSDIYFELLRQPSTDHNFDPAFFHIIYNYQQQIINNQVNPNLVNDIIQNLHNPIINLINQTGVNDLYKVTILQIMKSFQVHLNKLDEINNNTRLHFSELATDLEGIRLKIVEIMGKI